MGMPIGQLLSGVFVDIYGRRRMYGIELLFVIVGTIGIAMATPSTTAGISSWLLFWRLIMGIGIGGDYPLSAVVTAE
jgi:PHS family inorganic phosphate transporter-like MFS transporter